MKNLYNKGRYRNREYAKHLRPFLKKLGNRKWRMGASSHIENERAQNDSDQASFPFGAANFRMKA